MFFDTGRHEKLLRLFLVMMPYLFAA